MAKKNQAKRQVKIVLPEELYRELAEEAAEQGLSLAAYLRSLIFRARLRGEGKSARMSKVPDLFG